MEGITPRSCKATPSLLRRCLYYLLISRQLDSERYLLDPLGDSSLIGSRPTGRKVTATEVRRVILEQSKRAGMGHIGSSLSIADIVFSLYSGVLNASAADDADRDRFVLSKGHAALALYAALYVTGRIGEEELNSYCSNGSLLAGHPEHDCPWIDFSTGSLGHGLSLGAGAALAARLQNSQRKTFVLMSDAECNEGSIWEAAMFASHHNLSNLIGVIDNNGQQALGYTKDVIDQSSIADRWRAFGWDVHELDGHNPIEIKLTINKLNFNSGAPHMLVANTVLGKGVSYMEGLIKWHYCSMSDQEFQVALAELDACDQV